MLVEAHPLETARQTYVEIPSLLLISFELGGEYPPMKRSSLTIL